MAGYEVLHPESCDPCSLVSSTCFWIRRIGWKEGSGKDKAGKVQGECVQAE